LTNSEPDSLPSSAGSITRHLAAVKQGDEQALAKLWDRYYPALVQRARGKLRGKQIRIADEEDLVTQAFDAFYRSVSNGHHPDLRDRHGLWRMLLAITANGAIDLIRRENAKRRGGGRVITEAALAGPGSFQSDSGLELLMSDEPSPEFAALVAESMRKRLEQLDDVLLCQIAVLKLEGFGNREIAEKYQVTERTIERKLALIRKIWIDAETTTGEGDAIS